MTEKEETGFLGQIRRLSRRLSGNILSADVKDVRAYMARHDKRNIYSYDSEEQLRIGNILLKDLAEEFGTPLYVYDIKRINDNFNLFTGTLQSKNFLICYPVKVNPNLAILNVLSKLGSGFEACSGGEISRCLAAGIDASKITFSGCGKSVEEIDLAVKHGVYCINADSWEELNRIEAAASKYNKIQSIAIRLSVDSHNEGHTTPGALPTILNANKCGVPMSEALEIYSRAKASATLRIKGISCHISSQMTHIEPYLEIRDKLLNLADELRQESKICVEHIDLGGELATNLHVICADSTEVAQWIEKIAAPILERGLKLVLQPGSGLISDAGVLLTKIEYIKTSGKEPTSGTTSPKSGSLIGSGASQMKNLFTRKNFAIVDAGFNDFPFTAFFGQYHNVVPVCNQPQNPVVGITEHKYDIVGPINETIDVFYKDFTTKHKLNIGDYLIVSNAGAYGSSMASSFVSRNKPAEVVIAERTPIVIREREKYEDQYAKERLIPELKLKSAQILEENESQE